MAVFRSRTVAALVVLVAEALVVVAVYQVFVSVECRQTGVEFACRGLRSAVVRAMAVLAALVFAYRLKPAAFAAIVETIESRARPLRWLGLNLAGMALVFLPLAVFGPARIGAMFGQVFWFLAVGGLLAGLGAALWAAAPRDWARWLRAEAPLLVPLLIGAALIPDLANLLQPTWQTGTLSAATFSAVQAALTLAGQAVYSLPERHVIGTAGFRVEIGEQCSGIEGFALVFAFIALYAVLMRGKIHQRRLWLAVLPAALLASWGLNVVRIAVLVLIGAYVSPEHAVNGFHSFAGWLFFTILVFVMLVVMEKLPWLHRDRLASTSPALSEDWLAARLLPFVVFMFAGVVAAALWPKPELAYPLKAAALLAVVMYFSPAWRRLDWRLDPVALLVGLAVGAGWVASAMLTGTPDSGLAQGLAGLGPLAFGFWAVTRVLATVALVPLVEELFFRGYVLARLDSGAGGPGRRLLAVAVSSLLFAVFHGRWIEAGLAGVAFSLLMLRRGRLADAVVGHMAANLVVALWAAATGAWWVI